MKNTGEYLSINRLEFPYDPTKTTRTAISKFITLAKSAGKAGPIAQYLIGAKLQLRFPDVNITNERYSAGDLLTGRLGDFELGDTIFHITIPPAPDVFEKCKQNIEKGYRVFLLVPEDCVAGSRQIAEWTVPRKIAVEEIESFIANNLEGLSCFDKIKLKSGFRRLLEIYNTRVESIEPDQSLLIEIPQSLD